MKLVIIFLLATLAMPSLFGQRYTIKGQVLDSTEQKPLYLANVVLSDINDSTVQATTTNQQGEFSLEKLNQGTYALKISFIGFQTYAKSINVTSHSIPLGKIFMAESLTELGSVTVENEAPAVVVKEDTVEFNSSAYKTTAEANLEELLKKMPGIEIKDGKVTIQGQDISKIIVDGKPFFEGNASFTLSNLPADIVKKIQVIDEKSKETQFTGHDDGTRNKVINVVTKPEKRRGHFGSLGLTYSHPERYAASANLNYMHGKNRLTLNGNFDNLGQSLGQSYIVSNGRPIMVGGYGGGGISKNGSFNTSYYSEITEKLTVTASYSLSGSERESQNKISREFIQAVDENKVYFESTESSSNNHTHRGSLRVEYKLSDNNIFSFRQSLSANSGKSFSKKNGNTFLNDEEINSTDNRNFSEQSGTNISNTFIWRHKFSKKGRTISLTSSLSSGNSAGTDSVRSINHFSSGPVLDQRFDQVSTPDNQTNSFTNSLTYTEPVGEKHSLRISYQRSALETSTERLLRDFNEEKNEYSDIDTTRSSQFINSKVNNEISSGLSFKLGKVNISTTGKYEVQHISNAQNFPNTAYLDKTFHGFSPQISMNYTSSEGKRFRISYHRSMNIPQARQLQDVLDSQNPLYLTRGNPALSASYSNNTQVSYSAFNKESESFFSFQLTGSLTENRVTNNTIVGNGENSPDGIPLPVGARLTMPVNLDGYRNLSMSFNASKPIKKFKVNAQTNTVFSYSRSPQYLNNVIQVVERFSYGLGLGLTSNFSENLDVSIGTQPGYSVVQSTNPQEPNSNYFTMASSIRGTWKFGDGYLLTTSISHQNNGKIRNIEGTNQLLWNISVGKKFFNQKLDLRVIANDLLRQNSVINRNITSEYIQNSETNVLRQIVRFRLSYKFNKLGSTKKSSETTDKD